MLVMQPGDQFKYRLRSPIVEVSGRLIRQQKLRLDNQGPGQCHALLFATGKFSGAMVGRCPNPTRCSQFEAAVSAPAGALPRSRSGIATFSSAVNSGSR